MEQRSPKRIVLDRNLRLPPSSRLASTAQAVATWVFCYRRIDPARSDPLERQGVRVFPVIPNRNESAANELPGIRYGFSKITTVLAHEGITRLLVEGGPLLAQDIDCQDHLAGGQASIADEYVWFRGNQDLDPGRGTNIDSIWSRERFSKRSARPILRIGADTVQSFTYGID